MNYRYLLVLCSLLIFGALPVCCAPYALPLISVSKAQVTPRMDANLADPAWSSAAVIPQLGGTIKDGVLLKNTLPTVVRLLWDDDNLYLRFICTDSEIYTLYDTRDAELYRGDAVEFFLDVRGDSRQYVEIQANPHGSIFDQMITLTSDPVSTEALRLTDQIIQRDFWGNVAWNMSGLRVAGNPISANGVTTGWVLDMAIPAKEALKRLGESTFHPMLLRAHIIRYEWPKPTQPGAERQLVGMTWSPILDGCPHISPQAMGYLQLVK